MCFVVPLTQITLYFQLLETSGIQIQADAESDANAKVSMLLECLHERQMDIEVLTDMKREKLEQCIHLLQFENEANQVRRCVFHICLDDVQSNKVCLLQRTMIHCKIVW